MFDWILVRMHILHWFILEHLMPSVISKLIHQSLLGYRIFFWIVTLSPFLGEQIVLVPWRFPKISIDYTL